MIIADKVAIGYGAFSEALLDFLIIGHTVYSVKFMNRLREKSHDANNQTVTTPKDIELLAN